MTSRPNRYHPKKSQVLAAFKLPPGEMNVEESRTATVSCYAAAVAKSKIGEFSMKSRTSGSLCRPEGAICCLISLHSTHAPANNQLA